MGARLRYYRVPCRVGRPLVLVHPGDARDMMDVLPKESVSRAFLLYPDPWPKSRHHRRRFVTPEHLEPLAACLKPGAIFRIATDIEDYVRQTLEQVHLNGKFEWLAENARDWQEPWECTLLAVSWFSALAVW